MVNSHLENVFTFNNIQEPIPVRSASPLENTSEKSQALQFFTQEKEGEKILYNAFQDSPETLTLTVKLQDFKKLPCLINLNRKGRLVYSYPLKKEESVCFSRITAGDYKIELKNTSKETFKTIDISIVN